MAHFIQIALGTALLICAVVALHAVIVRGGVLVMLHASLRQRLSGVKLPSIRQSLIMLIMLLGCVAALATAKLSWKCSSLDAELRDLKLQREVDELIANIMIPVEAMYYDDGYMNALGRLRRQHFEKHQVERFTPYSQIVGISKDEAHEYVMTDRDGKMYDTLPIEMIGTESFELYWRNRVWHGCTTIAAVLESDSAVASYLREHRDVLDRRICPLLRRLLKGDHRWTRYEACRALLAAGDRSPETMAALVAFLREPKIPVSTTRYDQGIAKRICVEQYTEETRKAAKLVQKYGLKVDADLSQIISGE